MWIFCNPNPCHVLVGDCVIRACSISQDISWKETHERICDLSRQLCNVPTANVVWGTYLENRGNPYREPEYPITIRQFCLLHPYGVYTIGTGEHAVTVIDGDWYDIWDSGDELVSYYFEIRS